MKPHDNVLFTRLGFHPALDGLRGIAVILVMLVHFDEGGFPGGLIGVDVFFALSGFLITTLLIEEWTDHGRIGLRSFYARRALRLFPALFFFLLADWAVHIAWYGQDGIWRGLVAIAGPASYMNNWLLLQKPLVSEGVITWTLSPTWSLAVEEQFYLIWPLILIALLRWLRTPRALITATLTLGLASFFWQVFLTRNGATLLRTYEGTDTRIYGLLIGAVFAQMRTFGLPRAIDIPLLKVLLGVAVIALAYIARFETAGDLLDGMGIIVALASVVCVAAAVDLSPHWGPLHYVLTSSPLRYLGKISYALYLWHYLVRVILHEAYPSLNAIGVAGIGVPLSIGIASLSYRFVERPFLKIKKRFEPPERRNTVSIDQVP